MIELINKYKDLGEYPESLLLIDKYKSLFEKIKLLKSKKYDKYK